MDSLKKYWYLWAAGFVLFALATTKGVTYLLRNLRNHNPGNLRISENPWEGKVPPSQNTDGSFEQFQDYSGQPADYWGLRANMINLLALYEGGATSLNQLGLVWAPPADNGGSSDYGNSLASFLDVNPEASFDVPNNLVDLMRAVTHNEGWPGSDPYSPQLYEAAASAALAAKGYV